MSVSINGTTGISGVNGSASNPAIKGSDADTGIHFGTDTAAITTGGADKVSIDSSGDTTFSGTVKTSKVENANTSNGGVEIDTAGHVQVDGIQLPTVGALSCRNFVTNGAMQIAQRSTAAVTNIGSFSSNIKYDAADRWGYWASQGSKFTVQQVADAPAGFYNSLKITSLAATAHGAGDGYTISQRIEAANLNEACLGTADAKNLVASFWVKSSITGTFAFYMLAGNLATSFLQNFTIDAADTWEYKTINIPGPTSGTYNVGSNNYGIEFGFALGSGSSWDTATLGSWESVGYRINSTTARNVLGISGTTFQITGVQIELGDKATPFEYEDYGQTLAKCQRYYQRYVYAGGGIIGTGLCWTTANAIFSFDFRNEMRAAPTITLPPAGNAAGQIAYLGSNGNFPTAIGTHTAGAISTINFALTGSGYVGLAGAGFASWLYQGGTSGTTIQASAEL